jgi:hypothetical protein
LDPWLCQSLACSENFCVFFFILLNYHAKWYLLDPWLFQFCYAPRTSSSSSSSLSCQLMQIGFLDILTFAMLKDLFPPHHSNLRHIGINTSNVDSFQTIWRGLNLRLVVWGFCVSWWNMNSSIMGWFYYFDGEIFVVCYPFHDVLNSKFSLLIDLLFSSSLYVQAWRSCAL